MPSTARRLADDAIPGPSTVPESSWTGELHGSVAAMHREIEQRLLVSAADRMAVIPLPTRPSEAMIATMSRLGGWAAFGGGVATALALLIR